MPLFFVCTVGVAPVKQVPGVAKKHFETSRGAGVFGGGDRDAVAEGFEKLRL